MAPVFGRAHDDNDVGPARLVVSGLTRYAKRHRGEVTENEYQRNRDQKPQELFERPGYADVNIVRLMAANLITSTANPLFKEIRKAQQRGGLTTHGWMIAEGPRLLAEVARSGVIVECLVVSEGVAVPKEIRTARVVEVHDRVFRSISGTETPQGVMALFAPPRYHVADLLAGVPLVVVLDGVQDPGNAGTIVRSAEAFGATGVVFLDGSASPVNPKVLRASAGSLLRVPFAEMPRQDFDLGIPLFAGVSQDGAAPWECNFQGPCAIVVGSEGQGVSADLRKVARPVSIPTAGVESLNAAVAASLLLYEVSRQRAGAERRISVE